MEIDFYSPVLTQPILFELPNVATGAVELFPALWRAIEDLISPDVEIRRSGLKSLHTLGAGRLSPVAAYFLVTRLNEPVVELRAQIVQLLGDLLMPDAAGHVLPEDVRRVIVTSVSQICRRDICGLLEMLVEYPAQEAALFHLLKLNPFAGVQMADILTDKQIAIAVRMKAAHLIGMIGYLDAIPTLEKLQSRLDGRRSGQQTMLFAPSGAAEEAQLLPIVRNTLAMLKSP